MCARARPRRRRKGCAGTERRRRARAGVGLVRARAESTAWAPKTVPFGGKNHPTLDSQSRAAVSHNPHINAVSQTLWHSKLTTPWELRPVRRDRLDRTRQACGQSPSPSPCLSPANAKRLSGARGERSARPGEFLRRRQDAHAARRASGERKIHLTTNSDFRKGKCARFRFAQAPPPLRGLRRRRGYGALSRCSAIRSARPIDAQARRAASRCAATSAGVAATRARRRRAAPIE